MRSKQITIRKASGFQYSLNVSIVDTPKGAVRTIELVDHEVMMADKEPSDRWIMAFNENTLDTNTEQLKEFCEFILKEIDNPETMTREKFIRKWLANRDYEYNSETRNMMRDDLDKVINWER